MTYMLLISEPREQRGQRSEIEGKAAYQRMLDFAAELQQQGLLHSAASLRTDADAVQVQIRDGKTVLRDGPFTESKEMIGGFYLLDCATQEEAIEIAKRCPAAEWASVQVRQLAPCCDD